MQMVELTAKIADLLIQKIPVISETCAQGISVKFSIKNAATYQQKSRSLPLSCGAQRRPRTN